MRIFLTFRTSMFPEMQNKDILTLNNNNLRRYKINENPHESILLTFST